MVRVLMNRSGSPESGVTVTVRSMSVRSTKVYMITSKDGVTAERSFLMLTALEPDTNEKTRNEESTTRLTVDNKILVLMDAHRVEVRDTILKLTSKRKERDEEIDTT